jgi:hypothetical protein
VPLLFVSQWQLDGIVSIVISLFIIPSFYFSLFLVSYVALVVFVYLQHII